VTDTTTEIGFSLGSNLGDRAGYLSSAKNGILDDPSARFTAQSSLYETEPVGVKSKFKDLMYLNSVLVIESDLPAESWLEILRIIETNLGRERSEDRFAPRTIDVDILYAGDSTLEGAGLVVPHPRWIKRRFVVEPLAEVRPELVLPGTSKTVGEVLAGLKGGESCRLLSKDW
jgi:2-amino-4-hydroxy-6-hydroxymethyldihydropteridine diphosphokinase